MNVNGLSLILPRRLSHQIALAVSVLFALTVLFYTAYTVHEQSEEAEKLVTAQTRVLARAVAGGVSQRMLREDYRGLNAILLEIVGDSDSH